MNWQMHREKVHAHNRANATSTSLHLMLNRNIQIDKYELKNTKLRQDATKKTKKFSF